MTAGNRVSPFEHPTAMGSFRVWLDLLRRGGGVERAFRLRAAFVTTTTLLTSPLRLAERLRYGRAVARTAVHPAPIFIIGHWRTGTTHLQNLLCGDPALGYVSTFQAIAPGFCLVGESWLKPLIARIIGKSHPTRLIDNLPLSFDGPQEEEFAIHNLSPYSYLHLFSFPCRAHDFFDRYVLQDGLSAEEQARWAAAYLDFLRKVTYRAGGRRLVLKNPANAGRIRSILDLFPDARFIHTVRDPYRVYPSLLWVYRMVLPRAQLQHIDWPEVEAHALESSARLMRRYQAARDLIPPGHLVEVRFEDLQRQPLAELRRVYDVLDLPGYAEAEPGFRAYLESVRGYRQNRYEESDDVVDKVNRHWGFVLDAWHYPRRGAPAPS